MGAGIDEATFMEAIQGLNSGQWEKWADLWADDAVWHAAGRNPRSGEIHGKDAIVSWFRDNVEAGNVQVTPQDMLVGDDHFVFIIRIEGEAGGKRFDQLHADAWRIKDGKFVEGYFLPNDVDNYDEFMTLLSS